MFNSKLRLDVEQSSPEIRNLYSRLQQCVIAKENKTTNIEKQAKRQETKVKENEYAGLVTSFVAEEQKLKTLETSQKEARAMELKRVLEEQMAMKESSRVLQKADRMLEDMSQEDDLKKLYQKMEEERKRKQKQAEELSQSLESQAELRKLEKEKNIIQGNLREESIQNHQLMTTLKEEFRRQKDEVDRLKRVESQWQMYSTLDCDRRAKEEFKTLRDDLDLLKWEEEEKGKEKLKMEGAGKQQEEIVRERDKQIEHKKDLLRAEKEMEKRYVEILTEFQNEEAKTDQLSRDARRRRERIHRELSEKILEERKKWKLEENERKRMEGELEEEERKERLRLLRLQERSLIMSHAPHLDLSVTQKFLGKISDILP